MFPAHKNPHARSSLSDESFRLSARSSEQKTVILTRPDAHMDRYANASGSSVSGVAGFQLPGRGAGAARPTEGSVYRSSMDRIVGEEARFNPPRDFLLESERGNAHSLLTVAEEQRKTLPPPPDPFGSVTRH